MSFRLYDALGLPRGASKDEIKKAYRKLAVQHHPDKGGDTEKFKEISNAYSILSDDHKKAQYDQYGDSMMEGGENIDPRNIFEQFFGGGFHFDMFDAMHPHHTRGAMPSKCGNHVHRMNITLAEAYHGVCKTIKISLQKSCFTCKDTCNACQGRGMITDMRRMGPFTQMSTRPCDVCSGSGQVTRGRDGCSTCNGNGTYKVEERKEIVIPRGIHNGHQLVIKGMGEQPKKEGDIPGDLVFQILISEDPHFFRNGNDLIFRTKLTFKEAMLGKEVRVPHYADTFVVDTSSLGVIQADKPYIFEKKGMPCNPQGTEYGKLHMVFNVDVPTAPWTSEQRALLTECLNKIMG
jgi:DnaJ-class molecular chaperone